jgi:hypothetical protein
VERVFVIHFLCPTGNLSTPSQAMSKAEFNLGTAKYNGARVGQAGNRTW